MKFAVGQPVTRIEDTRLIKGKGTYTDDIKFQNMCYGVFVRSPYAHAKILSVDIQEAKKTYKKGEKMLGLSGGTVSYSHLTLPTKS